MSMEVSAAARGERVATAMRDVSRRNSNDEGRDNDDTGATCRQHVAAGAEVRVGIGRTR